MGSAFGAFLIAGLAWIVYRKRQRKTACQEDTWPVVEVKQSQPAPAYTAHGSITAVAFEDKMPWSELPAERWQSEMAGVEARSPIELSTERS